RLNLNAITFLSLRCSTTSAVTLAPEISGLPCVRSFPSAYIKTSPNVAVFPASTSRRSTSIVSPSATRYCLPPVLIIAYAIRFPGEKKPRKIPWMGHFDKRKRHNYRPLVGAGPGVTASTRQRSSAQSRLWEDEPGSAPTAHSRCRGGILRTFWLAPPRHRVADRA